MLPPREPAAIWLYCRRWPDVLFKAGTAARQKRQRLKTDGSTVGSHSSQLRQDGKVAYLPFLLGRWWRKAETCSPRLVLPPAATAMPITPQPCSVRTSKGPPLAPRVASQSCFSMGSFEGPVARVQERSAIKRCGRSCWKPAETSGCLFTRGDSTRGSGTIGGAVSVIRIAQSWARCETWSCSVSASPVVNDTTGLCATISPCE